MLIRFWNYSRDYSLNCTPLRPITIIIIINRAAVGVRGSSFARDFFFFNRAAVGVRGLRFTFGLFFLVLSVTWPRPLLGQVLVGTLNHATCNVYSPKAFETSIHENVTYIVFFVVCKIYFLLALSKCSIGSKQCVRTCKDYIICKEITIVLK